MPWKDKEKELAYKKAYYLKTKNDTNRIESVKRSVRKWVKNNRLQLNAYARKRYDPVKQKEMRAKIKDDQAKKFKKKVEFLTQEYMIRHLKKLGYTLQQIKEYPELINTYKIIIKTKRLWKQSQTLKT